MKEDKKTEEQEYEKLCVDDKIPMKDKDGIDDIIPNPKDSRS